MPAGTNRSRRKHQTAITHRLVATPAILPHTRSNSLLARSKPIKAPDRIGAEFAPIFHIRNEAKMRLPAVSIIHSTCAGPHGSMAKGTVIGNAVGTFTFRSR
jgi:hypothetical protein